MMKTRDCVENYVKDMLEFGMVSSRNVRANSCFGISRFFVSYNTPICEFRNENVGSGSYNPKFFLSTKKYSTTTSKVQNMLRHFIPSDMLVEVAEVKNEKRFPFAR